MKTQENTDYFKQGDAREKPHVYYTFVNILISKKKKMQTASA